MGFLYKHTEGNKSSAMAFDGQHPILIAKKLHFQWYIHARISGKKTYLFVISLDKKTPFKMFKSFWASLSYIYILTDCIKLPFNWGCRSNLDNFCTKEMFLYASWY